MLGLCLKEFVEMVEEKQKDPAVSLPMKEALLKLEVGLRAVEVIELREKLNEKITQQFNKDESDENKKTS